MSAARRRARVIVISGPSGGGKTTVVERLRRRMPRLVRSISVTTRAPRHGERRGYHYRFVSRPVFERLRRQGGLLEWADVHGAAYGTPRAPVERALSRGRDVILSIDVQGAAQIRRAMGKHAVLIFLRPPSMRQLRERLLGRRTETPQTLRRRLAAAQREIACARRYDYVIINDRLDRAVARVAAIVAGRE
jgi:guanylate kinase